MTLQCYDNTFNRVVLYYQAKWLVNYTCNHKDTLYTHSALINACLSAIVDHKMYDLILRLMTSTTGVTGTMQYNRYSKVAEHIQ